MVAEVEKLVMRAYKRCKAQNGVLLFYLLLLKSQRSVGLLILFETVTQLVLHASHCLSVL